jgi:DNA-binding Xre family transcriptional regulator
MFKQKKISYPNSVTMSDRRDKMIDYTPFWNTLEKSNENWYTLTNKHNLSHSTLHRLKHNKDVFTKTLNDLCRILNCDICDIVRYLPSKDDQPL